MSEKKTQRELLGRAMNDAAFRARLLADPAKVVAEEGYDVAPDVLEQLTKASQASAEALDEAMASALRNPSAGG